MFHAFDVSFARGRRQVIAEMNLELRTDELTVVIGPNGAGKSTLLKLLTGDLKPSSGAIWFDGRSLQQWNARELAGRRAVLSQSTSLVFPFTVHEVISLGLPEGIYAQDKRAIIQEMLQVFDLNGFEHRSVPGAFGRRAAAGASGPRGVPAKMRRGGQAEIPVP